MAVRLSKTSKMPGASWSLPVGDTCPGAMGDDGQFVEVCQGCYALEGFYRMKTVKAVRESNMEDWKRPDWVQEMVSELDNHRYFRWFDSGDCYQVKLAEKMLQVMIATPHCQHWFPTRMAKFAKFADVLSRMKALPNVVVRVSSDNIDQVGPNAGSAVVTSPAIAESLGATMCHAPSNDGKCGSCRACWSKDVPLVAYQTHGQSMKKIIRIKLSA